MSKEVEFLSWTKAVEEKSNEIVAIPGIAGQDQDKGQMRNNRCNRNADCNSGENKKKKRADYVLALREIQNSLYEDVQRILFRQKVQKNA